MHPDIVIVRTDRRSNGLSMIPDDSNTLTCQFSGKNNTPRYPLLGPIAHA